MIKDCRPQAVRLSYIKGTLMTIIYNPLEFPRFREQTCNFLAIIKVDN